MSERRWGSYQTPDCSSPFVWRTMHHMNCQASVMCLKVDNQRLAGWFHFLKQCWVAVFAAIPAIKETLTDLTQIICQWFARSFACLAVYGAMSGGAVKQKFTICWGCICAKCITSSCTWTYSGQHLQFSVGGRWQMERTMAMNLNHV